MSFKNYYYFDEEQCEFIQLEYKPLERIVYTASLWILCGIVIAGIGIISLSFYAGTPAEIALRAENQELVNQLEHTKKSITTLDEQIEELATIDNDMYRTVLGMKPISRDERMAGVGGADVYAKYDIYNRDASEILRWTASNIDELKRKINIQKVSFQEIKAYYNQNQKKLQHLPAIKPTKGVLLSGYGVRYHPVLKYRRMHDGLDFRARVGTPIYATGDGTIKFARRKSTLGNLVVINHGFGYESKYAHLSKFADGIAKGSEVKRGELIGYSGNTGLTEGPHLHYEIYRNGKSVDPIHYLFADISPKEYATYMEIAANNDTSMD